MTPEDKELVERLRDYPKGKPFVYLWEELQIEAADAIARLSAEKAELSAEVDYQESKRLAATTRVGELVQELTALRAQIAAAAKDAERYRWLRERIYIDSVQKILRVADLILTKDNLPESFDAAIDAAIRGETKQTCNCTCDEHGACANCCEGKSKST